LHRGGADDLRDVGGRGGGVDDVGEDDGDVVLPARAQGEVDEAVSTFVEDGDLAEDFRDRVGGDHPGQAVGAQQPALADLQLPHGRVEIQCGGVIAERSQDDRTLRVGFCLLGGDLADV